MTGRVLAAGSVIAAGRLSQSLDRHFAIAVAGVAGSPAGAAAVAIAESQRQLAPGFGDRRGGHEAWRKIGAAGDGQRHHRLAATDRADADQPALLPVEVREPADQQRRRADLPGVVRRPFAMASNRDDEDFNEVFFTDVRVPVENLVGPQGGGWAVANGSLGHERNMLWLSYADRLDDLLADFTPRTVAERDRYATLVMDAYALRALGSSVVAAAARGEEDMGTVSVLKLMGSEAGQAATEVALEALGPEGLIDPAITSPYVPLNFDGHMGSWFDRYVRTFAGTIAGGTSEIQRNIVAQRVLALPR